MGKIRRIGMFSTGMVKVSPEHIKANWKPMLVWMATSRRWTAPLPIQAFVVMAWCCSTRARIGSP